MDLLRTGGWFRNLDEVSRRTLGEVTSGRLTHTHRNRGPRSVYALRRGESVLVFVSRVAGHPNDLALLVPALGVNVVCSFWGGWWSAIVFIWETKSLIVTVK